METDRISIIVILCIGECKLCEARKDRVETRDQGIRDVQGTKPACSVGVRLRLKGQQDSRAAEPEESRS